MTNSFLSGDDYSGSHVGFPTADLFPTGYWLGSTRPRWFGRCGFGGATDADCDDWIVFVQPDPEYGYLQLGNPLQMDPRDNGNFDPEHSGSLENEIEQWLLPTDFRPEPGDRIYMTGRWIVDCGHADWHGELHPIESYVASHIERVDTARRPRAIGGIQTVAKVVVTGEWAAFPWSFIGPWELNYRLRLNVWAPPRPSATAVLRFEKVAPPEGNFGLHVEDSRLPATNPNHVEVQAWTSILETNFPRTHDYNQVYEPQREGVRLNRRMAAIYYMWWEEGQNPPTQ